MTFSLVARCSETGMFGVAISSSSPAVASRCAFVQAGVGAVASQNVTDPTLGPIALKAMEDGRSADEAIMDVRDQGHFIAYRQVLAIDRAGRSAIHSGSNILGIWGQAQAKNVVSAGNMLANDSIPHVIVDAFSSSSGHLGGRMIAALRAGLIAGGEAGPVHSAGLKLADKVSWPVADLRCDWTVACPIDALAALWDIYKPQLDDYVRRALDPRAAPSFGVPGDR